MLVITTTTVTHGAQGRTVAHISGQACYSKCGSMMKAHLVAVRVCAEVLIGAIGLRDIKTRLDSMSKEVKAFGHERLVTAAR